MKKIALIGTGVMGKRYMTTISNFKSEIELLQPCNSQRDWRDLLDKHPDGVIIAADPAINFDVIKYANILGIPVLCEKPVGVFLSDVQKMAKFKIPILADYTHLFSPEYQSVKALATNIKSIACLNYQFGPFRNFSPLFDYLPHDLAMCFDLLPSSNVEILKQSAKAKNGGIIYNIQLDIGKVNVGIVCGNGADAKKRQLLITTLDNENILYDAATVADNTMPLKNLIKHFLAVIDGAKPNPSFDLTVKIHEVLYKLTSKPNH